MNGDCKILYTFIIVMALTFLIVLFVNNLKKWRNNPINSMSVLFVLIFLAGVSDIIWAFVEGVSNAYVINWIVSLNYTVLFPFIGWSWLLFCTGRAIKKANIRWLINGLGFIIVIASVVFTFISINNGWIFSIDNNGHYVRGNLNFIVLSITLINGMAGTIVSIIAAINANLLLDKRSFITNAFCFLPVLLSAIVQNLLPVGLPAIYFGLAISAAFLFINSLYKRITFDNLTMINNRYMIDKLLESAMRKHERITDTNLWLIAIDLNGFKNINDTYGHLIGDEALMLAAKGILDVADDYQASVGRFGGDEFLIIVEDKDEKIPNVIVERINKKFFEISKDKEYSLSVACGIAEFTKGMTHKDIVSLADSRLYDMKHHIYQDKKKR